MWIGHRLSYKILLTSTWRRQIAVLTAVTISTAIYLEYFSLHIKIPATVVSILGISLSFFIGFLNSHAYERWLEARKAFGNVRVYSRDFTRMVLAFIPERELQRRMIFRQIAFIYATSARLRHEGSESYRNYLDAKELAEIEGYSDVPLALLLLQAKTLDEAVRSNCLDVYRMTAMNRSLNDMTASIGTCDRFTDTPFFPFYLTIVIYAQWAFVILFPMAIADDVGYWAIPNSFVIGMILTWLVHSAYALMDPYDRSPSAVALNTLARSTEIEMLQQLGGETIPSPVAPVNGVYQP